MYTAFVQETDTVTRHSERRANRFRQAAARRRLQEIRDEQALRNWLTEVWDEQPALIEAASNSRIHHTDYRESHHGSSRL